MQEDKEQTFDAIRNYQVAVAAMAGMITDLEPVPATMAAAAGRGFSTATDLADWLVRELKMPFRDAHHVTGAIVKRAETLGTDLESLPLAEMQKIEKRITKDVFTVLSVENSVKSRVSYGGTAPQNVRWRVPGPSGRKRPERPARHEQRPHAGRKKDCLRAN